MRGTCEQRLMTTVLRHVLCQNVGDFKVAAAFVEFPVGRWTPERGDIARSGFAYPPVGVCDRARRCAFRSPRSAAAN